jgi:methionyl-tRNA formyltransferase
MGVTLFCLGKKAIKALESLNSELITLIDCIVIGQDKNVLNDYSSDILQWAEKNHITNVSRQCFDNELNKSKYHIIIGWRWINNIKLSQQLIIMHDSLLPKYRGFNPLVTALINGDKKIGVTVLFGTDEYDKGDIISQKSIEIHYPIKIVDAIEKVSNLYGELLKNLLINIFNKQTFIANKQNEPKASYSLWRDETDYHINWNKDAEYIKRFIDAVGFPYKGAFTYFKNEKIRIFDVGIMEDKNIINRDVGKLVFKATERPVIVCGKGLLIINEAYSESGEKMIFDDQFRIKFA